MAASHTAKPAREVSAEPVSKSEQLGSGLDPTNNSKSVRPQAPDNTGESDYAFFLKHPALTERVRLPIAGEFGDWRDTTEPAFVRITIERDDDGWPKRRARRRLHFCDGGRA